MSIAEISTAESHTAAQLDTANPADIRRTLQTDFYNTFRFSQGRIFLQNALSVELGNYYRNTWSDEALAQMPEALDILQDKVGRLRPPGAHKSVGNTVREFNKRFATFRDSMLADPSGWPEIHDSRGIDKPQIVPVQTDKRLGLIADLMIDRDVEFSGRRNVTRGGDPAASFTRDYVLQLQSTGSAAYDDIFRRTHDQLVHHNARRRMELLQREWEQKHPGESFYSADFLADDPKFMRRNRVSAYIGGLLPASVLHMQRGGK